MKAIVRISMVTYWLALTIWIAAMVSAGIAAMHAFTRLPRLQMELKQFSALPIESHGRLAAGMMMEGVFRTVDRIQIMALPLVLISLIVQFVFLGLPWRSISNLLRTFCVVCAAGLFVFHITMLAPRMNQSLHNYWNKMETAQVDQAQAELAVFNALHPLADRLLRVNLLLALVAVAASAISLWSAPTLPPQPPVPMEQ
jgi:hypothetical protein